MSKSLSRTESKLIESGNMVQIAGVTMGEAWFNKEVGQALQLLEGASAQAVLDLRS